MSFITGLRLVAGSLCSTQALHAKSGADKKPDDVRLTLAQFDVNEKTLRLRYRLTNESPNDIWLCTDMLVTGSRDFEVVLDEEGRTLTVRRRLAVPVGFSYLAPLDALHFRDHLIAYMRLKPNETRVETLSLELPILGQRILSPPQPTRGTLYAERLLLQIGYCKEDFPCLIRDLLSEAERVSEENPGRAFIPLIGVQNNGIRAITLYQLNTHNDTLAEATDRLTVPYALRRFMPEDILEIKATGIRIPFMESADSSEYTEGGTLSGQGLGAQAR